MFCTTASWDAAQSALCSTASLWLEVARANQKGCSVCRPRTLKLSLSHFRGSWVTPFAAPAGTPVVLSWSACIKRWSMTSEYTVWTRGLWVPYCKGRKAATPSPWGTVPGMATAGVVSHEGYAGGVPARPAPRRIGGRVGPGLRDPVVSGGVEPSRVEGRGVPPDIGVGGGQLVDARGHRAISVPPGGRGIRPQLRPWCLARTGAPLGAPRATPGSPRWCSTRCPATSDWSSSACGAMCGSCGAAVATSRVASRGSPRGPGLACLHVHHQPLFREPCLLRRLGTLVVRRHHPQRCRRVGRRVQGFRPCHVRVGRPVFAVD